MIIVMIYFRWWSHNQDNREWFDDQQSDHRDDILGDDHTNQDNREWCDQQNDNRDDIF